MKILLVYPENPESFWSYKKVLKFVSRKTEYPPLGLLTVASMLPENWEKKLVDCNIRSLTDEDIMWADMVFVSAMIVQKESAQKIINHCKSLGKTVVAGGPVFTTQHEKFNGVDHFVLNEAEITLPMFLKDFKNGTLKKVYSSMERPDITKTPKPMWSLIDPKNYLTMMVQYSRGCPFNCEFCDIIIMNGQVPRTKSTEQVLSEFQAIYDFGWKGGVLVVDDNFIGNKVQVKKMLPKLIKWQKEHKYPFQLITEASTNLADDEELMQMMSAANFYKVFLGLETPSIESLKECGKVQNVNRDLADVVKVIQQHGMQVLGGFIVGFDSDPHNIFEAQIDFIQKVGIVSAMVGILTALPQTRLWHRLKKEGRLLGDSTGGNTDTQINFIPKMGVKRIVEGYKKIISTIYSPKKYYKRISIFIKNYVPTVKLNLSIRDVKAFFKSIWRIGILSKSRFRYWGLMINTLFTKIKAFPIAVELAIAGLHFELAAKRIVSC